jgi:hypothetical protein
LFDPNLGGGGSGGGGGGECLDPDLGIVGKGVLSFGNPPFWNIATMRFLNCENGETRIQI